MNTRFVRIVFLLFALPPVQAWCVISASGVFEVRVGGSDTNGGCYVTGSSGTDWTQQNAAQYATTDLVTNGTTTVTSATANWGSDVVGNCMYIAGGTGSVSANWYQIVTRNSSSSLVLDRSTGLTSGTGATENVGGALKSPSIAGLAAASGTNGNVIYLKNEGTIFSATSASTGVAGGVINGPPADFFVGYQTNRTIINSDSPPTFQLNVASATAVIGSESVYVNIIFDGNSQTSSRLNGSSYQVFINDTIKNFNTVGNAGYFIGDLATGNSASVLNGSVLYCEAEGNTATPIVNGGAGSVLSHTLSYNNTGSTTDGALIQANNTSILVDHFTSVGNGRDGVHFGSSSNSFKLVMNTYTQGNAGYGFNWSGLPVVLGWGNGCYNNALGCNNGTAPQGYQFGQITPTGDAFTNAPGNVYALNNLASQGALLRSAAIPALFPRGLTANYEDVNAARHQDPASTSGPKCTAVVCTVR